MTEWIPKVTIITPAYNAARFLPDVLKAVQDQTFKEWEHIIVDDGSTDNTAILASQAAASEKRIRFLKQNGNQGVVEARNLALREARGRYIAFLDADDLWLPEKLKRQLGFMEAMGYAFTYHLYHYIDESGSPISAAPPWIPPTIDYSGYLKLTGTIGCVTVMIDTQATGLLQMEHIPAEDFVLWLRVLERVGEGHGLYEDLARYRVVSDSLSSNKVKTVTWIWNVLHNREGLSTTKASYYLGRYIYRGVKKKIPLGRLLNPGRG